MVNAPYRKSSTISILQFNSTCYSIPYVFYYPLKKFNTRHEFSAKRLTSKENKTDKQSYWSIKQLEEFRVFCPSSPIGKWLQIFPYPAFSGVCVFLIQSLLQYSVYSVLLHIQDDLGEYKERRRRRGRRRGNYVL